MTARKREESFVDVPSSLTVVGAEQLEAYDTQQLKELAHSVPNMYVDQTNSGKRMSVRGFGNVSINAHFGQAVGFSVDGLSLQRSATWELGYFKVPTRSTLSATRAFWATWVQRRHRESSTI